MGERRDYLSVCNDQGTPLPDFQAMFCVRCVQPECSRSRAGGLFETRVTTWEERLFINPPRMQKSDPRYAGLAAKRFVEIDMGRVPEVNGRSDWTDPRVLEEPSQDLAPKPRVARAAQSPIVNEPKESPSPEVRPAAEAKVAVGMPLNTPFTPGVMLSGATEAPPTQSQPEDRWATAPEPASVNKGIAVVKVGARIKFT